MTIQEMLDTIESLNSECLYNLPNFTFDEVCENFIKGKFPDSTDDEQVITYYHDGAGADSIKSEMSSIKGNLNKAGKTITAIQSCFKKQDENVIVFGTNETFMAQLEDVILSMSKALASAVGLVYQMPDEVLKILEEMKKIKEEIEKSSLDIFEYFKQKQEETDNLKKDVDNLNKEIEGFTPGMTSADWEKVNTAIQSGIDKAVGTDSSIQKEINDMMEQLRKQGVAIDNLGHSYTAAKLQVYDTYIEGTVANLGINIDGTIDYARTHLVMTSDEAYLTAQKIQLDSYGNVTNIRTAGLVLQSDYAQDVTEEFESSGGGAVRAEQEEGQVIVFIYDTEELEEPQRTHRVYKVDPGYSMKVEMVQSIAEDKSDLYGMCMCDASGTVLEKADNSTNVHKFTKRDTSCYLYVSDKYVTAVYVMTDSGTFATLFAQAVDNDTNIVKQAQITAFVTKTEDGYLESGVLIKADNIKLEGYISANNGFTIDTDGSMTATSGTIGGFTIGSYSLDSKDDYENGAEMYLSRNLMRFSNKSSTNNWVFIGSDVMPASMGGALSCPMRVEVNRETQWNGNAGILLDIEGAREGYDDMVMGGNHALYISNGDITGFRLKTRRLGTSTTLSKMDSIIFIVKNITVSLPDSPQEGQLYYIRQINNVGYTIAGNGHKIMHNGYSQDNNWSIGDSVAVVVIWDRVNQIWIGNYLNN